MLNYSSAAFADPLPDRGDDRQVGHGENRANLQSHPLQDHFVHCHQMPLPSLTGLQSQVVVHKPVHAFEPRQNQKRHSAGAYVGREVHHFCVVDGGQMTPRAFQLHVAFELLGATRRSKAGGPLLARVRCVYSGVATPALLPHQMQSVLPVKAIAQCPAILEQTTNHCVAARHLLSAAPQQTSAQLLHCHEAEPDKLRCTQ
mmetsp:Transcript_29295/g.75495  ORF Transcript_29295/g.75495 Transcript_29295/m.75495 type:complete len:201 (-) Transcript_29295:191-793(-)